MDEVSPFVSADTLNLDAIEIRLRHFGGRAYWGLWYHGTEQASGHAESVEDALAIAEATKDAWFKCELANLPATEPEDWETYQ